MEEAVRPDPWARLYASALQLAPDSGAAGGRDAKSGAAPSLFRVGVAATVLRRAEARGYLERAAAALTALMHEPEQARDALARIRTMRALTSWILDGDLQQSELSRATMEAADALREGTAGYRGLLRLLLRCLLDLGAVDRLTRIRDELATAWDEVAAGPEGELIDQGISSLNTVGHLDADWCRTAWTLMRRSIGWTEPWAIETEAIVHYRRMVASSSGDTRAPVELLADLRTSSTANSTE